MKQIRRDGDGEKKDLLKHERMSHVHRTAQVEKRGERKNYKSFKILYIMRKLIEMLNV